MKPKETDFEPKTLGEHIRKRRINLSLCQQRAAKAMGVTSNTILNWEKGHTKPPTDAMPAIFQFLGYDPFPEPRTLSERMRAKRRRMGWSIQEAAVALGVDGATWGEWERTGNVPWRRYANALDRFLGHHEN